MIEQLPTHDDATYGQNFRSLSRTDQEEGILVQLLQSCTSACACQQHNICYGDVHTGQHKAESAAASGVWPRLATLWHALPGPMICAFALHCMNLTWLPFGEDRSFAIMSEYVALSLRAFRANTRCGRHSKRQKYWKHRTSTEGTPWKQTTCVASTRVHSTVVVYCSAKFVLSQVSAWVPC